MTIRIKATHPETQGEYVIINKDDFDPSTMEQYSGAKPAPKGKGK